jgi:hypothetical protein
LSDNFIQLIREAKTYNVKTFDEFIKELQAMDERIKACDIETDLTFSGSEPNVNVKWVVNSGYMNDKNRVFVMKKFENGVVECDAAYRFRAPGCVNVNKLVDPNQILSFFDSLVFELERDFKDNKTNNKKNETKKSIKLTKNKNIKR